MGVGIPRSLESLCQARESLEREESFLLFQLFGNSWCFHVDWGVSWSRPGKAQEQLYTLGTNSVISLTIKGTDVRILMNKFGCIQRGTEILLSLPPCMHQNLFIHVPFPQLIWKHIHSEKLGKIVLTSVFSNRQIFWRQKGVTWMWGFRHWY